MFFAVFCFLTTCFTKGVHSIESANVIMKGYEIFYNFIKKHEALNGKTPSEMAIPSLQFETANRWLELIKLAIIIEIKLISKTFIVDLFSKYLYSLI